MVYIRLHGAMLAHFHVLLHYPNSDQYVDIFYGFLVPRHFFLLWPQRKMTSTEDDLNSR